MVVHFRGTAHPPPGTMTDGDVANLSAAELQCTGAELENRNGIPVLYEHNSGRRIGRCLTSWEGKDGEMRVAGVVDDPEIERSMRSGKNQGLSLGTDVVHDVEGRTLYKAQQEISVCGEPRRLGCYIDTIDGKRVRQTRRFSAGAPLRALRGAAGRPLRNARRPRYQRP